VFDVYSEWTNRPALTAGDDQLVEEVLSGDSESFRGIVSKYEKPIFNLMYRATGSREEAADLTQDAFLRAYERLHSFRIGQKFFSWLYALALNIARDHLRKQKRTPPATLQDLEKSTALAPWAMDSGDEATRLAETCTLFKILRELPLKDREAVIMRFRDGLTMREIADRLHISVSGAKMRVHRGLAKLRQAWGEMHYDT
jgi:RNA polymerase sigma-70 factor (ECF subfamily)